MTGSREGHGQVALVGGSDDFGIAHRSTGLNGGGGAGFGGGDQSIRKREKSVAAHYTALEREFGFARFPDGNPARVYAAHLARADAEGAVRADVDDGDGFEVLYHSPAIELRAHFFRGGLAARDDFQIGLGGDLHFAFLHEEGI